MNEPNWKDELRIVVGKDPGWMGGWRWEILSKCGLPEERGTANSESDAIRKATWALDAIREGWKEIEGRQP